VIERAIVLAHGKRIELEDLPEDIRRLESVIAREGRSLAKSSRSISSGCSILSAAIAPRGPRSWGLVRPRCFES
jgi:hypothetical protein